jgi:hypothetical protein
MKQSDFRDGIMPVPIEGLLSQTEDEVLLSSRERQKRQRAEDRRWLQDRREEIRLRADRRKNLDERRAEDRR